MTSKTMDYEIRNPGTLSFICNICGASCEVLASTLSREEVSCKSCKSTVRMRGMIYALSLALYGRPVILPEFEENMNILGRGMSDWDGYAKPLAAKVGYINTYYHKEPKLDITDISPKDFESVDFLISTDVFEHISPPVSNAFLNAKKMLRSGGSFVFSVPYTLELETTEHFPNLNTFKIESINGIQTLVNKTKDGIEERYQNLVFHGSSVGGETLEMRVFSEQGLLRELAKAGFDDVRLMKDPCFEYGIYWSHPWSVPIIARKKGISIRVQNWGPQSINAKSPQNLQSNGLVGLWLIVSGLIDSVDIELMVADIKADELIIRDGLITAFIPPEILESIGSKPIVLSNPSTGASLYVGSLVITR